MRAPIAEHTRVGVSPRTLCSVAAHDLNPPVAQDDKADVILKYMADEARNLKAYGELPENIRVNDTDAFEEYEGDENDDIIEFDDIDNI